MSGASCEGLLAGDRAPIDDQRAAPGFGGRASHVLAEHFAVKYAARVKRSILGVSPQARQRLLQYDWPGNVRELENAIERAAVLGSGEWIQPGDLPESVLEATSPESGGRVTLYDRLRDAKRDIVLDALQQTGGNFTRAGELLGVHANHLHRLVRTLEIEQKKLPG